MKKEESNIPSLNIKSDPLSKLKAKASSGSKAILLVDYVRTELDTFEKRPFSDPDALVLAQFAYTKLRGGDYTFTPYSEPVFIKDVYRAENFEFMYSNIPDREKNIQLITAMAASPRFRDIRILDYVDKYDSDLGLQFSAMTLETRDGLLISYRGTDSTFTGWKEDFSMAFMDSIPAQEEALIYLERIADAFIGAIRLCGHSKGGNLAMYAALRCDKSVRDRITTVHDLDGPGFKNPEKYEREYSEICEKVVKILPESSIVGLLLKGAEEQFKVVESAGIGFMQHAAFTWKIKDGEFVAGKKVADISKNIDKALSAWLAGISQEDREAFIDTLFEVLSSGGAKTFSELISAGPKQLAAMYEAITDLPEDVKKNAAAILRSLFGTSIRTLISGD